MKSLTIAICGAVVLAATAIPQTVKGTVDRIKVHGKSLEGNLEGDSPDRDVSVYLPPSYRTARGRRYPVIYLLHGYTDDDNRWFGRIQHFINVPEVVDRSLASGTSNETIVVMPNAYTRYQGSMYSNSATTGDWETYIAKELVAYIDGHYRTLANAASRGLAGHSMGGYGTMRIGMKYPDVFSAIYALSPCCMIPNLAGPQGRGGPPAAESIHNQEEFEKADFGTKAQFASAAAWSPNPKNPPFFFDLPTKDGKVQNGIMAKWAANAPLAMVDQNIGNLRRLHAIAFDAGDKDTAIAATIRTLDGLLNEYNVPHTFEIYEGTHTSGIAERVGTKTLPFFSANLSFQGHAKTPPSHK
jgi:S-formylglutathione hydrolase